ncbi:tetratricopeptide repeat protein [Vibrio breoganii]
MSVRTNILIAVIAMMALLVFAPSSSAANRTVEQLSYIAQDKNNERSERINALEQLTSFPSQSALIAIARGLKDNHHDIREASVKASAPYQLTHRWRLLSPLMDDLVLDVRMAVAENLVVDYAELNAVQRQQFDPLFDDWASTLILEDTQASMMALAHGYLHICDYKAARDVYGKLIERSEGGVDAWIGIAESYRLNKQDDEALTVLNDGLVAFPNEPRLLYAKSLTLVRLDEPKLAAKSMDSAAKLAETNSQYWYINGVLQEAYDQKLALDSLKKAYEISELPEQLYAICDFKIRHSDNKAEVCVMQLEKIAPPHVVANLRSRIEQGDVVTH